MYEMKTKNAFSYFVSENGLFGFVNLPLTFDRANSFLGGSCSLSCSVLATSTNF